MVLSLPRFPLGLENLENGKVFSSQGKVREFWTDWKSQGKFRENHTKYWKTEINWDKYYSIFLVIFKWTVHFLVKWIKFSVKKNKTLKKYWKMAKNNGKVREFCQSGKVGTLFTWNYHCAPSSLVQLFWDLNFFTCILQVWSLAEIEIAGVQ